jgi:enamine deaminase RidA (YjgF/YER057c/UK114 family)
MAHQRLQPTRLFPSNQYGFSQVVKAAGGSHIFCAGQTAWDREQNIVGSGDFRAQVKKTLENVEAALNEAGAGRADVTTLRIFVVDYDLEKLPVIAEELSLFFGPDNLPANTLLGVEKLALPDFMIEIEAFAIID